MRTKMCNKCYEYKSYDDMVKNKNYEDGVWYYCKECHRKSRPRKLKPLEKSATMRECRMCGQMKRFAEYVNKSSVYRHSYCLSCRKTRGLQANLQRYGLTPEQYVAMEKSQGGVCAICKEPEREKKRLAIDHDHSCCSGLKSCGKCLRGLLCTRCNKGIGIFGDDQQLLISATNYLKNY